jgi:hypothetical protein
MLVTGSTNESTTRTKLAPAYWAFETFVTSEQLPLWTRMKGFSF